MKEQPEIKAGLYRHSKSGKLYRVLGTAKHSENLEPFVVYEAQYENPESKLWIRPYEMFIEEVEINGKKVPRFGYAGN
jgi:hypothetical protein